MTKQRLLAERYVATVYGDRFDVGTLRVLEALADLYIAGYNNDARKVLLSK